MEYFFGVRACLPQKYGLALAGMTQDLRMLKNVTFKPIHDDLKNNDENALFDVDGGWFELWDFNLFRGHEISIAWPLSRYCVVTN